MLAQSIVGNGPFESLMTTTNARSRRAELPRTDLVGGFGAGGRPGGGFRISKILHVFQILTRNVVSHAMFFSQPCHVLLWRPRAYDAETILLCNDTLQGRREARLTGVRPKLGNLAKELNNLAGLRPVPAPQR